MCAQVGKQRYREVRDESVQGRWTGWPLTPESDLPFVKLERGGLEERMQ